MAKVSTLWPLAVSAAAYSSRGSLQAPRCRSCSIYTIGTETTRIPEGQETCKHHIFLACTEPIQRKKRDAQKLSPLLTYSKISRYFGRKARLHALAVRLKIRPVFLSAGNNFLENLSESLIRILRMTSILYDSMTLIIYNGRRDAGMRCSCHLWT